MKKVVLASFAVLLVASFFAISGDKGDGPVWKENYQEALKEAKTSGKYVLVDFTGSDWCGWCIKLDKEVFDKAEFKKYASENLVLVSLDFPKKKKQNPDIKKQNQELAKKYGVRGFPTIFLLDSNGEKVAQFGYRRGGPAKYVQYVQGLIEQHRQQNG